MIPAAKHARFNGWFAGHAEGRMRSTFGRVLIAGRARTEAVVAGRPVLLLANHTAWWDALVALVVSERVLRSDGYALMDARNLRRLPFFRRVGAFGVDLEDPSDGARAIRYAARLLGAPGRTLWVFPQGREHSPFEALHFKPGAAQIARVARTATVIPVGLRYIFGEEERPDLFIAFGEPLPASRDVDELSRSQLAGVERCLATIDAAIASRDVSAFEVVFHRRPSILERWGERLLALLFRDDAGRLGRRDEPPPLEAERVTTPAKPSRGERATESQE